MKIVVDMMGGDHGLEATLPALRKFHESHPDVELIAVGDKAKIGEAPFEVVDAPEALRMDAGVMDVFRDKTSSMAVSIITAKDRGADAVISAGSTAAFLSLATLRLKKMEGILRPALISDFPTLEGGKTTILDIGASNENTPEELVQFAIMGSLYHKAVHKKESPRVYLLSNGTEEDKGKDVVKQAHKMLKESKEVNFLGNIEARETLSGDADVIVADGYSGNVLLKSTEGTAKAMSKLIKKAFKKNLLTKIGYLFARSGFKQMSKTMDYKSTGGAILLGINSIAVKAHGNSEPYGFYSALEVAYKGAKGGLLEEIRKGLIDGSAA